MDYDNPGGSWSSQPGRAACDRGVAGGIVPLEGPVQDCRQDHRQDCGTAGRSREREEIGCDEEMLGAG